MKRSFCTMLGLVTALAVLSLATPARALEYPPNPATDTYWAILDESGELAQGGGSGWMGAGEQQWFFYPDGPPEEVMLAQVGQGWWTQWFYDHPTVWDHYKVIQGGFWYYVLNPSFQPWSLEVAINWTNPAYTDDNGGNTFQLGPPLPDSGGADYIERQSILSLVSDGQTPDHGWVDFSLIIPWYNPEWISIDIRGQNIGLYDGVIVHECVPVPEPATWMFLSCGIAGLAVWRRRRSAA